MANCHNLTGTKLSPIITGTKLQPVVRGLKLSPIVQGVGCADDFTGVTYLFNDEFTTDQNPVTNPRTTEPGGQAVTIIENGTMVISNQILLIDGAIADDQYIADDLITMLPGYAFGMTCAYRSGHTQRVRFRTGAADIGFSTSTGTRLSNYLGSNESNTWNDISTASYTYIGVARSATEFLGTNYTIANVNGRWEMIIMSIDRVTAFSSLSVRIDKLAGNDTTKLSVDSLKITALSSPFDQDYGLASYTDFSTLSPGSFTHESEFFIQLTITTLPTVGTIDIQFQYLDASNYWYISVTATGTIELWEVVAGAGALRGSSASSVANGRKILVGWNNTISKCWVWSNILSVNCWADARIKYNSAPNITRTAGNIAAISDGQIDDLIVWKLDLDQYATLLNRLVSND